MDILSIREKIYDHFQASQACQDFFFADENEDRYSGYYTSMYLIQDTSEALQAHRARGFSEYPLIAYIEIWGVLQAIVIQQDAIAELYRSASGSELDTGSFKKWREIRELRNICAGHPARKDRPHSKPLVRTFMGRSFGGYSQLQFEQWQSPAINSYPAVNLGVLINQYENEAGQVMAETYDRMKQQWLISV